MNWIDKLEGLANTVVFASDNDTLHLLDLESIALQLAELSDLLLDELEDVEDVVTTDDDAPTSREA